MDNACETPLLDLLRSVPPDATATYEHSWASHSHIPYGRHCRAAADEIERLRLALETATHEKDDALRTVKALTPAANYCLEYKPLLLKAERERDEAVRVLRDIATFGWYAKGAKVARAYLAAREGR